jgi:DNA gyrase subunit A
VLVVSEKGYGKRTQIDEYRITNRGGKGVKTISVTDKTGPLVGMLDVTEKEDLMITCKSGVIIRMSIGGISEQGRATQGVKLIRLDGGDEIAAITKLEEKEDEEVSDVIATSIEGETTGAIEAAPEGLNTNEEATGGEENASEEESTDNQ